MRNVLVCRICENRARPGNKKWYRCLKLHQICEDCKSGEVKDCSCGEPISDEHDMMTEKLLSIKGLKFNCANTKNGCRGDFTENALEDHESECLYRLVSCPGSSKCSEKVTFLNVIPHYEKYHCFNGMPELNLNTRLVFGENHYRFPVRFCVKNETFIFKLLDEGYGVKNYLVYILGSPEKAKNFSYTLKFFGTKATLTFEGKVAAIDESFETLLEAGKCFSIPRKNFDVQIMDVEERKYELSVEIRNLKEDAMDENYESGISDNEDMKE